MLTVNYINIANIDRHMYHFFKPSVSLVRQEKADQYRFFDDAKRCVFAELLLQYSFFQKIGSLKKIELDYNEFGKPFIRGKESFLYNISHAGNWVVIAYGDIPIGVDIEKICGTEEYLPIEAFTKEERDYINAAHDEDKAKRFTQTWTLKESYVKYIGTGLSTDLDSFSILIDDEIRVKKDSRIQEHLNLDCQLFQTDYYLSICSPNTATKTIMHEINLIDLIDFAHNKEMTK